MDIVFQQVLLWYRKQSYQMWIVFVYRYVELNFDLFYMVREYICYLEECLYKFWRTKHCNFEFG